VPLKIFRPDLELVMVESRARKTAFLREAARLLELPSVIVLTQRAEDLPTSVEGTADLVTIRAVRPDQTLLVAIARLLRPTGRLLTFGLPGQLDGFRQLRVESVPGSETTLAFHSLGH
jgi:16S rRNA (guanine527-N7)-methyltransferase